MRCTPISEDYAELTPYQFSSNNPIGLAELEGFEGIFPWSKNRGKRMGWGQKCPNFRTVRAKITGISFFDKSIRYINSPRQRTFNLGANFDANTDQFSNQNRVARRASRIARFIRRRNAQAGITVSGSTAYNQNSVIQGGIRIAGIVLPNGTPTQLANARGTALQQVLQSNGVPAGLVNVAPPTFGSTISGNSTITVNFRVRRTITTYRFNPRFIRGGGGIFKRKGNNRRRSSGRRAKF